MILDIIKRHYFKEACLELSWFFNFKFKFFKFKCTFEDRSFTAAAPKIWNDLPDHIRKDNDFGYY